MPIFQAQVQVSLVYTYFFIPSFIYIYQVYIYYLSIYIISFLRCQWPTALPFGRVHHGCVAGSYARSAVDFRTMLSGLEGGGGAGLLPTASFLALQVSYGVAFVLFGT